MKNVIVGVLLLCNSFLYSQSDSTAIFMEKNYFVNVDTLPILFLASKGKKTKVIYGYKVIETAYSGKSMKFRWYEKHISYLYSNFKKISDSLIIWQIKQPKID